MRASMDVFQTVYNDPMNKLFFASPPFIPITQIQISPLRVNDLVMIEEPIANDPEINQVYGKLKRRVTSTSSQGDRQLALNYFSESSGWVPKFSPEG